MRIGIVGLGRIGSVHAGNLCDMSAVGSLVVTDVQPERAAAAARRFGAETVPDMDALLRSGLDGVVIASSSASHYDLVCRAIRAAVPVFCEKPLAADLQTTLQLSRIVDRGGVPVQVGFQRRFDPGHLRARQSLMSGSLGRLHTIRAVACDPSAPALEYLAGSGGFLRDAAVHDFDIVRWITGLEIVEVSAIGADYGIESFRAAGDVASVAVAMRLEDETIALVSGSRLNKSGYDVRLELLGFEDSVVVGWSDATPVRSAEAGVEWPCGPPYASFLHRFQDAYKAELAAFLEVTSGRAATTCTVRDAAMAIGVAEACGVALRERRSVRVSEVLGRFDLPVTESSGNLPGCRADDSGRAAKEDLR